MIKLFKCKTISFFCLIALVLLLVTFSQPLAIVRGDSIVTTNVSLISSVNPSVVNQPIVFTATVSPVPDGGTIQFQDNGTNLGPPIVVNASGQAAYTSSGLATH